MLLTSISAESQTLISSSLLIFVLSMQRRIKKAQNNDAIFKS